MALTVREIDHLVLRTTDMPRALRFYAEVLGCHEERRLDELGLVQLRAGRSMIDLIDVAVQAQSGDGEAPARAQRNQDHFCVRIDPWDEAEIHRILAAHGIDPGRDGHPLRRGGRWPVDLFRRSRRQHGGAEGAAGERLTGRIQAVTRIGAR